jgi:hypothetical protein
MSGTPARTVTPTPSTLKTTVPVGVPEAADTVAVHVTSCPGNEGSGTQASVVVVGRSTCWVKGVALLSEDR